METGDPPGASESIQPSLWRLRTQMCCFHSVWGICSLLNPTLSRSQFGPLSSLAFATAHGFLTSLSGSGAGPS